MSLLALLVPGVGMGGGVTIVVVAGPYCIAASQAYTAGAATAQAYTAGVVAAQGVCQ